MKHGRRDSIHTACKRALERAGRHVFDLADAGGGLPDLIVSWGGESTAPGVRYPGINLLLEIKTGDAPITPAQREFFQTWPGPKAVARSVEEALRATGIGG